MCAKNNVRSTGGELPLSKVATFCKSYSLRESQELFCRATITLARGDFQKIHDRKKAMILDYFEALQDLLPAIYELRYQLETEHKNKVLVGDE